jgi:enamine deaminase RidA (YjgF/YER057c/UK114 family)
MSYLRAYLVPTRKKAERSTRRMERGVRPVLQQRNNPVKPARSTVGVMALVNAEWLVEVEAFAVFPPQ